ncbi:MAG TPA: transporter substrate-binding domain-containing protein [Microbacteriaceae bacterium]
MSRSSKLILSIIGIIILALGGGFFGSKMAGGGGGTASASGGAASGSWINAIKKSGQLRVGIAVAAPMTATQPDGTLGGPLVIPMQNLAKQLHVKFVPVATTWGNIVAGLQAGRYDAAAYLDNTLERATSIQFSNPVLTYQAVFVVKADSPYTTSPQVFDAGQPIASAQGATPDLAAAAAGGKMLEVADYAGATAALKVDRAIAVAVDLPTAEGIVQQDSSLKIVVPDPVFYQSGSGFGLPESIDPRSLQLVNIAILDAQDYGDMTAAYKKVGYREINSLGDWQKR